MPEILEGSFSPEETSQDNEISRLATQITLARVESYQDLWAKTEQQGDKIFKQKTRELWRGFVVHGVVGINKETGGPIILDKTDLDGRCCLGLLGQAGISTKGVEYVAQSSYITGKINLDTGNRHGVVIEDEGKTAFFDHHSDESGRDSSATKITYEVLTQLGLLERQEYLDRLVEFVTQIDNRNFPGEEDYFEDSPRMMLGLAPDIKFSRLLEFFKAGRQPTEWLDDKNLKELDLDGLSKKKEEVVKSSLAELEKMENEGFIVDTPKYGRVAIDTGSEGEENKKRVKAGWPAAKAHGCGGYVIWNSGEKAQSFFISTAKPLEHKFPQGFGVRGNMWIKPRQDPAPLIITLGQLLGVLSDGQLQPRGELKKYLGAEKAKMEGQ